MNDNLQIGNVIDFPKNPVFPIGKKIVTVFFRWFFRFRVHGVEQIPNQGGIIVASNHISNFDPPLIGISNPRYIRFMAKAELFSVPGLRSLIRILGAFPIQRGKVDKLAIRSAIEIVKQGGCLVMFPEGHRSKTGELGEFMPGVAAIARKSEATIVPTVIIGPYRLFRSVEIFYGEPFSVKGMAGDEILREIRSRMQRTLDEHGVQA